MSVVIGSYNRRRFLNLAIESVRRDLSGVGAEIVVVDGGSDDGTLSWLIRQKDIVTILQHNRGVWRGKPIDRRSWGYFMNLGFRAAAGRYICMLSDDCLVIPGAIPNGIKDAERLARDGRRIGSVAFYWRNWPAQASYWVGRTFGGRLFVNHGLYLREALLAVGYADEHTYGFYHADGDMSLRMWEAGYECIAASHSFVEHYAEANPVVRESNLATQKRDWERYTARWSWLEASRPPDAVGDWILREHIDPDNTAQRFNALPEVRIDRVKATLKRVSTAMRNAARRVIRSLPAARGW